MGTPSTAVQLRSLVSSDGTLELSLVDEPVPEPREDQVVVRIEAAPINPSDLGLLFGGADMSAATASGTADRPVITAPIAPSVMKSLGGRVGATRASITAFIIPAVAVVLGAVVLDETVYPIAVVGCVVVLIGAWIGGRAERVEPAAPAAEP